MKRLGFVLALVCLCASSAFSQGYKFHDTAIDGSGRPLAGVSVGVCSPLATTFALVSNNLATLTMSSNPVTAGFVAGGTLIVAGFSGSDSFMNGTYSILAVSPTSILFQLVHANWSTGTQGTALQQGNSTTPCAALASIYADPTLTTPVSNPVKTDGLGNYTFAIAPGSNWLQIYGPSVSTTFRQITPPCVVGSSSCGGGGGTPGGSNRTLQGNSSGAFGGVSGVGTDETFTSLVLGPSNTTLWSDVRFGATGAKCDGSTNDSTPINSTINGLSVNGGTAYLPNNCVWTPPTSLPTTSVLPTIGLGGALYPTSTIHITGPYSIKCLNPALSAPGGNGWLQGPTCPIQAFPLGAYNTFNPIVSVESQETVLKDITVKGFCGTGVSVFSATAPGSLATLDNVWADGVGCQTGSTNPAGGLEVWAGFGVNIFKGGFGSSAYGTQPSMWFHGTAVNGANQSPSIFTVDQTFMNGHGMTFDVPGASCGISGLGGNIRLIQQTYENANSRGLTPPDANSSMYNFDVTKNCGWQTILIDSPSPADGIGYIPLINVYNSSGTGSGGVTGLMLVNPSTGSGSPIFGVEPGRFTSVQNSFIEAPLGGNLGLTGTNCSYFAYLAGRQINCASGNGVQGIPVADIGSHVIGLAYPYGFYCSASSTGGSLATGTYDVIMVSEGLNISGTAGESVPSSEYELSVTGPTGSISCNNGGQSIIVPGAAAARVYVGTTGSLRESEYFRTTSSNYTITTLSGGTSSTPQQLQPLPETMAVTDYINGTGDSFLATAGNLGVGTQSPTQKLDVAGNAALTIGGFHGIFTHADTANRTYTFPDVTGTVCLVSTCAGTFYQTLEVAGTAATQRPTFNFIAGTNMTIGCVDNGGSARTDCTFTSSATAGTAYSALTPATNNTPGNFIASGNAWDFTSSTLFKGRAGAGLTTTVNGDFGYDSTSLNWHGWDNAADSLFLMSPVSTSWTNGDCVEIVKSTNTITATDAGVACAGAVTAVTASGFLASSGGTTPAITVSSSQGTDSKLLTAGTTSASTGIPFCTDANHGATTSSCVYAIIKRLGFGFGNCNGGTAASGFNLPASSAAVPGCSADDQEGFAAFADGSLAYVSTLLPADFVSVASVTVNFTTSDVTAAHTIKPSVALACTQPNNKAAINSTYNAAATATVTIPATPTANAVYQATITGITSTGCAAGYHMRLKFTRATDTSTDTAVQFVDDLVFSYNGTAQ